MWLYHVPFTICVVFVLKIAFCDQKKSLTIISTYYFFFKHLMIFNKKGQASLIKTDEDSVFTRSHAEFLLPFSIDQSFKRLSKLIHVTGTLENLNLGVNLNFVFLQKYGVATIFFLYGNKNVPSAETLRGRRCPRTRTFILFGLTYISFPIWWSEVVILDF